MTALFAWNDAFVTHLPSVDEQHRKLVDLINGLSELCMSAEDIHPRDFEAARDALARYAQEHFSDEEWHMQRSGVDPRHQEQHCAAHRGFLREVQMLGNVNHGISAERTRNLLDYLVHWLTYHILGIDQSMARQALAIRAGKTPAQAYEDDTRESLADQEPLIHALRGLLQMLSLSNAELRKFNHDLEQRVAQRTADLEYANRQLQMLSSQDDLTGLPNRRFAVAALNELWAEARRDGTPMSVLLLDADHFKPVNDQFGHAVGDELLRHLAQRLRNAVRTSDIVCRLGGDEFLVICPRSNLHGAVRAAQKILDSQEPFLTAQAQPCWDGSLSIGIAEVDAAMLHTEDLLKRADRALYEAKQKGGSRAMTS